MSEAGMGSRDGEWVWEDPAEVVAEAERLRRVMTTSTVAIVALGPGLWLLEVRDNDWVVSEGVRSIGWTNVELLFYLALCASCLWGLTGKRIRQCRATMPNDAANRRTGV